MFTDHTLDDHQSEPVSFLFRRKERLEKTCGVFGADSLAFICDLHEHITVVTGTGYRQRASLRHRLHRIFDQIVKCLLQLVDVSADLRQSLAPQTVHRHVAALDFMAHEGQGLQYNIFDVKDMHIRL